MANRFNCKLYIDMVDTDAFHMEVSAYSSNNNNYRRSRPQELAIGQRLIKYFKISI